MQRFMFIPTVATFGCLFCGVWVFYVKCQNTLQLFLISFSIWHLSIVIDGHTSSDRSPGLIPIKVHCFLCLSLIWVLWVRCHCISSLCHVCGTQCIRCVRVIFSVFSFFCYVVMGEKIIIIALSQQNTQKEQHAWKTEHLTHQHGSTQNNEMNPTTRQTMTLHTQKEMKAYARPSMHTHDTQDKYLHIFHTISSQSFTSLTPTEDLQDGHRYQPGYLIAGKYPHLSHLSTMAV